MSRLAGYSREHHVEDVKVALSSLLRDKTRLLKKILVDTRTLDLPRRSKLNVDVLAEARRIIIPKCSWRD
jgi:hypothetical protein